MWVTGITDPDVANDAITPRCAGCKGKTGNLDVSIIKGGRAVECVTTRARGSAPIAATRTKIARERCAAVVLPPAFRGTILLVQEGTTRLLRDCMPAAGSAKGSCCKATGSSFSLAIRMDFPARPKVLWGQLSMHECLSSHY